MTNIQTQLPEGMHFGPQACASCGHRDWAVWPNNVISGFANFECPNCHAMTMQLAGPALPVPMSDDVAMQLLDNEMIALADRALKAVERES